MAISYGGETDSGRAHEPGVLGRILRPMREARAVAETWADKWRLIETRWHACVEECWSGRTEVDQAGVARVHVSAPRCKAAIEALAQDLWALRDWLIQDATSGLDAAAVDGFLDSPDGYHVRSCGDLATRAKHFRVDDPKKHLLQLERADEVKDNVPIVFRAVRVFQQPAASRGGGRPATGDTDQYEDAVEMLRRAIRGWSAFLQERSLIREPIAT